MASPSPRTLALLGAGFAVWAIGFAVLYAILSLGCALGWERAGLGPVSLQRAVLLALALAALLATALVARRIAAVPPAASGADGPGAFVLTVSRYGALAAVPATAFTFLGVTMLSTCS